MLRVNKALGFTLVELVIAIVVASIVMTGVVVTSANLALRSADPMLAAQRLHIARSYIEEITAQSFRILACTPIPTRTDINNICSSNGRQEGTIFSKARSEITQMCQYEEMVNVQVENQFGETSLGVCGYTVSVVVDGTANLGPAGDRISNTDAAIITVTITSPDGQSTALSSYATNI